MDWTANAAISREITNDNDATVIVVDAADLNFGSAAHGQLSGVTLTMTCQGANLPAMAGVVVP